MTLVPRVRTPLDDAALSALLRESHVRELLVEPSPARLSVAWAQCALETGRGNELWNHNIGNLTAGPEWRGDFWTWESEETFTGVGARHVVMHFRAYHCAEEGACDWWRRMASTYRSALPFFDAGDGEGAARELSRLRYFTGPVEDYARSLRLLAAEWLSRQG